MFGRRPAIILLVVLREGSQGPRAKHMDLQRRGAEPNGHTSKSGAFSGPKKCAALVSSESSGSVTALSSSG